MLLYQEFLYYYMLLPVDTPKWIFAQVQLCYVYDSGEAGIVFLFLVTKLVENVKLLNSLVNRFGSCHNLFVLPIEIHFQ